MLAISLIYDFNLERFSTMIRTYDTARLCIGVYVNIDVEVFIASRTETFIPLMLKWDETQPGLKFLSYKQKNQNNNCPYLSGLKPQPVISG